MKRIICILLAVGMLFNTCFAEGRRRELKVSGRSLYADLMAYSDFDQSEPERSESGAYMIYMLLILKAKQEGGDANAREDGNFIGRRQSGYDLYARVDETTWVMFSYDASHCAYTTMASTTYEAIRQRCAQQYGNDYYEFKENQVYAMWSYLTNRQNAERQERSGGSSGQSGSSAPDREKCRHEYQTVDMPNLTTIENTSGQEHRILTYHTAVCALCKAAGDMQTRETFAPHAFDQSGMCVCGFARPVTPCAHEVFRP